MAEKTEQAAEAREERLDARRERELARLPNWRRLLEQHSAWQDVTQGLDIAYAEDGLRCVHCTPTQARQMTSILAAVIPHSGAALETLGLGSGGYGARIVEG